MLALIAPVHSQGRAFLTRFQCCWCPGPLAGLLAAVGWARVPLHKKLAQPVRGAVVSEGLPVRQGNRRAPVAWTTLTAPASPGFMGKSAPANALYLGSATLAGSTTAVPDSLRLHHPDQHSGLDVAGNGQRHSYSTVRLRPYVAGEGWSRW